MLKQVNSGGQTGIDYLALEIAKKTGIPTGGYCPKDYWTENGSDPSLADFGLVPLNTRTYPPRTARNVRTSDATIWFGSIVSPGFFKTSNACDAYQKHLLVNPTAAELIEFVIKKKISTINVAGNRGSKLTEARKKQAEDTMLFAFTVLSPKPQHNETNP